MQLRVTVYDSDNNAGTGGLPPDDPADDTIGTVVVPLNTIESDQTFSTVMQFSIDDIAQATIGISYRLLCSEHYYGKECSVYCKAQDSDEDGHFTCDEQGNVVCNDGYQDETTYCVTCKF